MTDAQKLALTLAHEAEERNGMTRPEAVVNRARVYLDFLSAPSTTEGASGPPKMSAIDAVERSLRPALSAYEAAMRTGQVYRSLKQAGVLKEE